MDSSHNACPDGKGITGITASLGEWCTPFLCVAAKQHSVGMSTADTGLVKTSSSMWGHFFMYDLELGNLATSSSSTVSSAVQT